MQVLSFLTSLKFSFGKELTSFCVKFFFFLTTDLCDLQQYFNDQSKYWRYLVDNIKLHVITSRIFYLGFDRELFVIFVYLIRFVCV